jgi:hypothetical protein
VIRFFDNCNDNMLGKVVGEVKGKCLCGPLLGQCSMVGGAKLGCMAVLEIPIMVLEF